MGAGATKKTACGRNSQKEDQSPGPSPSATKQKKIPNVDWTANGSHLMWLLLTEAEKEENRKVLFGKRSDQNSSAEHKTSVHKRIASVVIPQIYALDSSVAADRVKARVGTLISRYRSLAIKVTSTGGGVSNASVGEDEFADSPEDVGPINPEDGSTTGWIASVPRDGPDHDTPERARNVWEFVEKRWPFFPRMHRLLCARPNVVPVAITTGVGPHGESTIYYQLQPPPSHSQASESTASSGDGNIDPALRGLDVNQLPIRTTAPSTPTATSQSTTAPPSSPAMTPNQKRLAAAVAKADKSIKTVPKKRTFEERFIDTTQETLRLVQRRIQNKEADRQAHLQLEERRHWMKELEMGIISKDQYRSFVYGGEDAGPSQLQRRRRERSPSPPWDLELSDKELAHIGGSDDVVDSQWSR